ncbi:MAG: undecaprenyldiphospho-muramoylpentapeptide beta-N-acetylglucosaminyltransferase [Gammaproteobacteria bacterium]
MSRAVMILAGGTGGHVYPGLAVAEALRAQGCELVWMGTRRGVEARVVPAAGVPLLTIPVTGLRRSGPWRRLGAPFTVAVALACALVQMLRVRPRVVLGMGGFVSGPGGVAAWLCRRPLVIHEQNAIPGLTNRLLARLANRVFEAFPGTFPAARRAVSCGNPVRREIAALEPPAQRLGRHDAPRVLVFGGSRGARALNASVPGGLAASGVADLAVLHQCGEAEVVATRARYAALPGFAGVEVTAYIDDMAGAYAAADLVIARAGAITVAELAACGAAAILVPYPYAVDDHQTANARYLVDAGAALLIPEHELDATRLGAAVAHLLGDRARLVAMAEQARALARPDAVATVAGACLEYVDAA